MQQSVQLRRGKSRIGERVEIIHRDKEEGRNKGLSHPSALGSHAVGVGGAGSVSVTALLSASGPSMWFRAKLRSAWQARVGMGFRLIYDPFKLHSLVVRTQIHEPCIL